MVKHWKRTLPPDSLDDEPMNGIAAWLDAHTRILGFTARLSADEVLRMRAEDVLNGFEAGADDYLQKPFELSILIARINALLRRHAWHAAAREKSSNPPPAAVDPAAAATPAAAAAASDASPDVYTFAGKTVDFDAQELRVKNKKYPLTLMEVNLLRYLVQHEGKAVSRKNMLEDVWNLHEDTDTRAIDHFIARLRKYVEKEPPRPRHLQTVRGVGYKFVATPK